MEEGCSDGSSGGNCDPLPDLAVLEGGSRMNSHQARLLYVWSALSIYSIEAALLIRFVIENS